MERGGVKASSLFIAVGCGITLAGMATPAFPQVGQFDIPSEDAEKSIPELARQSGVQIIGPGEPLKSVITPKVKGTFDVSAALVMMLKGTDLVVSRSADGIIMISPRDKGCNAEGKRMPQDLKITTSIFALLVGALTAPSCHAQTNIASNDAASLETVVVTGFRNSLNKSLQIKQNESGVVDTIVAEDIGKFPDSNLAESMQRVPGVALQRGDGGEGRTVTVRGLGPIFTRTRINGLEASSGVGGTDATGTNRGRSFDFSAFASELFQNLTVRKTYSADTDEGSLGATVDLFAPHPLDYNDKLVVAASAKASYNSLNDRSGPRLAGLASWKTDDDTFGLLVSGAYTKRRTREEGYSPSGVYNAAIDGGFCSPIGYAAQNPTNDAVRGTDALNCANGVPRLANTAANNAAYASVVTADAWHPRLPRYFRSDQAYERSGLTASAQWRPNAKTLFTLDGLMSRYHVDRNDYFMQAHSFGRGVGAQGKPDTSIVEAVVDTVGNVQYGKFNGVDLGSINTRDVYTSTFEQVSLTGSSEIAPWLTIDGVIGTSVAKFSEPIRFDIRIDDDNVNGFSFDFRGGHKIPVINYGADITDPNTFSNFGPIEADGTVHGSLTGRQDYTQSGNQQFTLNAVATLTPWLKIRSGIEHRRADFDSQEVSRTSSVIPTLPTGVTMADVTTKVKGFGQGLDGGLPDSWVTPDWKKFDKVLGLTSNVGIFKMVGPEAGNALGNNFQVDEQADSAYVQGEFDTDALPVRLRGNIGVRYVETHQRSFGYVSTGGASPVPTTVKRTYGDWLPSINLTADITDTLLVRASAAKVMARPELSQLNPAGGFNAILRQISTGNAALDPIRADTVDFGTEWYFQPGSLLSVGVFYKDVKSYIQSLQRLIPYGETGLPNSLLVGSPSVPEDMFTVTNLTNTKGGPIKGVETYYQQEFRFLPGIFSNTGMLLNYTYVEASITYILNAVTQVTRKAPLVGMSKNQLNGTLYYEDDAFTIRGSANYRSGFVRTVPSTNIRGDVDKGASTLYFDFSAAYNLTDKVKVSLEGQNLTDQATVWTVDSVHKGLLYDSHFGRTFTVGVSYRY